MKVADEIRARLTSPADVIAALGIDANGARKMRSGLMIRCPAHEEKSPSCSVSDREDGLGFHCFGCGASGDVFDLVAIVSGLDVRSDWGRVLERAGQIAGIRVETRDEWKARRDGERAEEPERDRLIGELAARRGVRADELGQVLAWCTDEHLRGLIAAEPPRDPWPARIDRAAEAWIAGRSMPELDVAALTRWVLSGGFRAMVERERVVVRALRVPRPRNEPTEADWDRIHGAAR